MPTVGVQTPGRSTVGRSRCLLGCLLLGFCCPSICPPLCEALAISAALSLAWSLTPRGHPTTVPPLLPSLCLGASFSLSLGSVFPLIIVTVPFWSHSLTLPPGACLALPVSGPLRTASLPALLGRSLLPSLSHFPSCPPPTPGSESPSPSLSPHLSAFACLCLSVCLSLRSLPPVTPFRGCLPGTRFSAPLQPPAWARTLPLRPQTHHRPTRWHRRRAGPLAEPPGRSLPAAGDVTRTRAL